MYFSCNPAMSQNEKLIAFKFWVSGGGGGKYWQKYSLYYSREYFTLGHDLVKKPNIYLTQHNLYQ